MASEVPFGAAAGALSTLSPCVLPLIPIVLRAAAAEHRRGPAALAARLAVSFAVVGLFVATVGFAMGLDTGVLRALGGTMLAARDENLGQVAATMLAVGVGAAVPLLLLAMLSREALMRWRGRLMAACSGGRQIMGALLLAVGLLILSGFDKRAEAWLVEASPAWLTRLTTAI